MLNVIKQLIIYCTVYITFSSEMWYAVSTDVEIAVFIKRL